jgi:hypothetical protein
MHGAALDSGPILSSMAIDRTDDLLAPPVPAKVASPRAQSQSVDAAGHSPTSGRHGPWPASPLLRRRRHPVLSARDLDGLARRVAQVLVARGLASRLSESDTQRVAERVTRRMVEQQRTGHDLQAEHLIERVAQRVVELQEKQADRLARRLAGHLRARPATSPLNHDSDKAAADLLRRLDEP